MSDLAMPPPQVVRHCRNVTRTRARNFYYGLRMLPEPRRSALYAMYAWMRRADDMVDDSSLDAAAKREMLTAYRTATEQAIKGHPPDDDPMWAGVAFVCRSFNVRAEHLHAMLEGQFDDLRDRNVDSFDALRQYCYRVASTVGLVCIEIWGYSDPAARELAIDRGIAFQLTNILRDFNEDLDHGRVYLPSDELAAHGLDARGLQQWSKPQACSRFVLMHVHRAEEFYNRSEELDAMVTPSCRPTLRAMTKIYRGLLEKIKADPSRIVGGQRIRLSAMHKLAIAVQARLGLPDRTALARAMQ